MMDVANLTRIVEESFRDSVSPGEEESDLFEVYDLAIPHFLEMIQGKDWKGFLHVLETCEFSMAQFYGGMVYFMTPQAFHYFAPAFLIFSLNEKADVLADAFFGHLYPQPESYESQPERVPQLIALFSEPQKRAVALVVDYYTRLMYPKNYARGLDESSIDLRRYWESWMVLPQAANSVRLLPMLDDLKERILP